MGKNLESKVDNLISDLEGLNRSDMKKLIMNFVTNEMDWASSEHTIDNYDLVRIHSAAVKEITDFPIGHMREHDLDGNDQSKLRTLCYFRAVLGFLNSSGFCPRMKINHIKKKA